MILDKLQALADMYAERDLINLDLAQKSAEIMRPVQPELEALSAEYAPLLDTVGQRIAALEAEIKQATLVAGKSQGNGGRVVAVYTAGRTAWDGKRLEGYAAAHPEIEMFKSVGAPSVSIRVNGAK